MTEIRMTPQQMVALFDAALRCPHPLSFLDSAVTTFKMAGRHEDGTATAWIGCLYAEGEIELLMRLKAAWKLGQAMDPESVIRPEMRRQR